MISHLVKSLFGNKTFITLFLAVSVMSCASKTHVENQDERSEHLKEASTYQR